MFQLVTSEDLFEYVFLKIKNNENKNFDGLFSLSKQTDKYDEEIIKMKDVPFQLIQLISDKSDKYIDYLIDSLKIYYVRSLTTFIKYENKIIKRIKEVIEKEESEYYSLVSGIFHKLLINTNKYNDFIYENLEVCHHSILSKLLDKDIEKYAPNISQYPFSYIRYKISQHTDKYDTLFLETTRKTPDQDFHTMNLLKLIYNKGNIENKLFLDFQFDEIKKLILSNTDIYDEFFLKDKSYSVRLVLLRKNTLPLSTFIYDNNSQIIQEIKLKTSEFNSFFEKRSA